MPTIIRYVAALALLPSLMMPRAAHALELNYQSSIVWLNCSQTVPDAFALAGSPLPDLVIANLPSTLHCGTIDVPMDYGEPISSRNKITISLAMLRPNSPKGAIFYNGGGTDANVATAWEQAIGVTDAFSGLADFDLMFMDVRGTFASNQLNVSLDTVLPLLGPWPRSKEEFEVTYAASAAFIKSWIDNSSPPGIIEHVGTREVVQDYEQIRKALCYEKINFLGSSYGSFRAAKYASTFPNRVDRLVFDAVVPHGRTLFDRGQDSVAALNRGLLRADAYCQNNSTCYLHTQGKGSVPKAFKNVLSAAQKAPLTVCTNSSSSSCTKSATVLDIQQGMQNMLGETPDFPAIFGALKNGEAGIATDFAALSTPSLVAGLGVSILLAIPLECNDNVYNTATTYSDFTKSLKAGMKVYENDITGILQTQIWLQQIGCSAWPFKNAAPDEPLPLSLPMLIVTADFDNLAPTEFATFSWKQYPKAALVVRHGDDHTSFSLSDSPAVQIINEYLNTGILPTSRQEELVSVYHHPEERRPISDPYKVPTGALAGDIDSGADGNVTVPAEFLPRAPIKLRP